MRISEFVDQVSDESVHKQSLDFPIGRDCLRFDAVQKYQLVDQPVPSGRGKVIFLMLWQNWFQLDQAIPVYISSAPIQKLQGLPQGLKLVRLESTHKVFLSFFLFIYLLKRRVHFMSTRELKMGLLFKFRLSYFLI